MTPFKRALRAGFKTLLRLYFRRIEEVGERPSPATRGRVFISNHSNAFIDPILVLTHAPCDISPLAKSTLWSIPGFKYLLDLADAVPVQRRRDDPSKSAAANDEIFDKIARHLESGGNVLVFPEGTSHNEPQLIRLKTGAARMLERARVLGAADLTFQTVGLAFDERHKFRSRAAVAYGPVRRLSDFDGDLIETATQTMRADLAELVIEGSSWQERRLVLQVAELIRNDRGDDSFAEAVRIGQEVERARDQLRSRLPVLVEDVERCVGSYFSALEAHRLTDEQLSPASGAERRNRHGALAWLGLPLAPVGVALYWLPYQLPRLVAGRTDEIDQHSTLKLATGMVAYPIWAGALIGGAWAMLRSRRAAAAATVGILAAPFAALYWLEHMDELRQKVSRAPHANVLTELRAKRAAALAAIERARSATEP